MNYEHEVPALTLKHIHADGSTIYVQAVSVQLVRPEGKPPFLKIESSQWGRREAYSGKAYLMNSTGKTIDVFDLSQIMPQPE